MRPRILLLGSTTYTVATVLAPLAEVSVALDLEQAALWGQRGHVCDSIVCVARTTLECLRLRQLTPFFPRTPPENVLCVWFGDANLVVGLALETGHVLIVPAEASRRLLEHVRSLRLPLA